MQQDIVIFAPHQDDEILGAYEIIRQQPEHTYVVFLTNGDYEGAEVAKTRWHESRKALTHLGVPEDHMIALGYADTGMPRMKVIRRWFRRVSAHIPITRMAVRNITLHIGVHMRPIPVWLFLQTCVVCLRISDRVQSM